MGDMRALLLLAVLACTANARLIYLTETPSSVPKHVAEVQVSFQKQKPRSQPVLWVVTALHYMRPQASLQHAQVHQAQAPHQHVQGQQARDQDDMLRSLGSNRLRHALLDCWKAKQGAGTAGVTASDPADTYKRETDVGVLTEAGDGVLDWIDLPGDPYGQEPEEVQEIDVAADLGSQEPAFVQDAPVQLMGQDELITDYTPEEDYTDAAEYDMYGVEDAYEDDDDDERMQHMLWVMGAGQGTMAAEAAAEAAAQLGAGSISSSSMPSHASEGEVWSEGPEVTSASVPVDQLPADMLMYPYDQEEEEEEEDYGAMLPAGYGMGSSLLHPLQTLTSLLDAWLLRAEAVFYLTHSTPSAAGTDGYVFDTDKWVDVDDWASNPLVHPIPATQPQPQQQPAEVQQPQPSRTYTAPYTTPVSPLADETGELPWWAVPEMDMEVDAPGFLLLLLLLLGCGVMTVGCIKSFMSLRHAMGGASRRELLVPFMIEHQDGVEHGWMMVDEEQLAAAAQRVRSMQGKGISRAASKAGSQLAEAGVTEEKARAQEQWKTVQQGAAEPLQDEEAQQGGVEKRE